MNEHRVDGLALATLADITAAGRTTVHPEIHECGCQDSYTETGLIWLCAYHEGFEAGFRQAREVREESHE